MRRFRFAAPIAVLLVALVAGPAVSARRTGTFNLQVLGINDFHGTLDAGGMVNPNTGGSSGVGAVSAGGAEFLATHVRNLQSTEQNSVVVSAGDLIGASPLLSGLFHDEPTIEAMNLIGLDINAVGNHEFDEGAAELRRMQDGGSHPQDGDLDGTPFDGADFRFLAANVRDRASGQTIFPQFQVRTYQGVRVAFIGMTLEATPDIVSPEGVEGLEFDDEADTVNRLVPQLKARGVEAFVVMIHEGGFQTGPSTPIDSCNGISGAIVDVVNRMDDEVDLIVSGHTHAAYNCVIDGRRVTSTNAFGRLVTEIDMTIDRATRDIVDVPAAAQRIVTTTVPADSRMTGLLNRYRPTAERLGNRIIGRITADLLPPTGPAAGNNSNGTSPLGSLIADAQLEATQPADLGAAQIAFMNPGGIRAPGLLFARSQKEINNGRTEGGEVTYEEAFTVQPFGNSLVTMTLTGAQIEEVLEDQFQPNQTSPPTRVLQPSEGFTYTYNFTGPADNKVDPATIRLNGVTINPTTNYRVTVNSFLAGGGDRFPLFAAGTDRLGGALDLDALEDYFTRRPGPVSPPPANRATRVN